jgi:hypothetical protein
MAPAEYGDPPRWPAFSRMHRYWHMLAYTLVMVGKTFEDPSLYPLAERQLQWLLGKNIMDISDYSAVGERSQQFGSYIHSFAEYYHDYVTSGRRVLLKEIAISTGGFSSVPWGSGRYPKDYRLNVVDGFTFYPRGFPHRFWPLMPYTTDSSGPEFYLPFHGTGMCAALAVAAAMEDVSGGE